MTETVTSKRSGASSSWFQRGALTPFRDMGDILERLWESNRNDQGTQLFAPPLDISETESTLTLRMDLPGVSPHEIEIQVNGNQLTVCGERRAETEERNETFHCIERRFGRFSRSVALPFDVEEDQIEARYQEGVLRINLPKSAEAKTRRIEVKV